MWNSLAVLLSALALNAPQAGVVTNVQPTWSPDGRWIAYASDRGGRFDVWKTDGVHVRRVARDGQDPAWSPDGKKIAFVTGDARTVPSIYVTAASGTRPAPRRIAYYAFDPSWSPNARRMAFTAPTGGCDRGAGIWVMRSDGALKALLVESPDEFTDYVDPAWSPDGKRIAYAIPNSDQGESGIAIVPVEGGSPTYVSEVGWEPSWSPDGRRIVFSTPTKAGFGPLFVVDLRTNRVRRLTRMLASGPACSPGGKRIAFAGRATDGSSDIYLIDPDGSHLVRLTRTPPSSGPPGTGSDFTDVQNLNPDWSPDGRRIAFVTNRRVSGAPASVALIGADGSGRRILTRGGSPAWSPDAQRIAYVDKRDSVTYLEVIDAGENRRRLLQMDEPSSLGEPDWAPDGRRLAFEGTDSGVYGIFVVDASGGPPSLLVARARAPDWSPDGSRILFTSYDEATKRHYVEVANSDGRGRRQIAGASTPFKAPRWSPDARRIAFEAGEGIPGVFVMNTDGGNARRITDGGSPSWSPDGSAIAFQAFRHGYEIMIVPARGGAPRRVTYGGCTAAGTEGPDALVGGPTDDVLCGFGGNDVLRGQEGDDRILGGNGRDRILGGAGPDRIFGEDGADAIDGGPGADAIRGGNEGDAIRADDGDADFVDGGEGVDCAQADARDYLLHVERRTCRGSGG